jgi:NADH-ubiquinone oxidoreductase chain 2
MLEFLILTLTSFFPYNIISENFSISIPHVLGKKQTESLETTPLQGEDVTIKKFLQTNREHYSILEYPLITIFVLIGGITLLSSNDLITMFLSLELQSYGLYILSTIYRNSESSTSAGLTYFLLGGLSSCIILLGQSLLYVNLGTTHLDGIYIIHNIFNSDPNLLTFFLAETMSQEISGYASTYVPFSSILSIHFYKYSIQLAFIIIAIGFLFKISASPFHS